jgi:hypothetical protein
MLNVRRGSPGADRTGRDRRARYRAALAACGGFVAILIVSGCSDDGGPGKSGPGTTPDAPAGAPTGDIAVQSSVGEVDACTLLTHDEVGQVLGGPVIDSGPTFGPGESLCEWKIDGDWSVTVSVGSPDTAPENRFDPQTVLFLGIADPVESLDGAYYVGLGIVAFAVDERLNTIQVVAPAGEDASRSGVEALAPLVAQRLSAITG